MKSKLFIEGKLSLALKTAQAIGSRYPKVTKAAKWAGGIGGSLGAYSAGDYALKKAGVVADPSGDIDTIAKRAAALEARQKALEGPSLATKAAQGLRTVASNRNAQIGAGVAGVGLAGLAAANVIKNKMKKRSWVSSNCANTGDAQEKNECLAYVKNNKLNQLKNQLIACPDENCKNNIREKISLTMNG